MQRIEIAEPVMQRETFDRLRDLVHRRSGISLGEGKESLVRARVSKRMRTLGLTDYAAYLARVEEDRGGEELIELLDVISTNVTSFFREERHFHLLSTLVHNRLAQGQRRLRYWSAACSSGEEPYTMAMTLREAVGGEDVDLRILATDLSTRVLARAREGAYGPKEVDRIPPRLLQRYFQRNSDGSVHRAGTDLRSTVSFSRLNLTEIPYPMNGPFDGIFCRNVMIYFDRPGRERVVAEMARLLRPGGHLFVGHAESLAGSSAGLRSVEPSVYVKP